jgi:DNA polymerase-3 subunit epsilon
VSLLFEQELAAIDFETTGLFPEKGDRAIEVAVVRGRYGETPTTWSTLLDPGRPVDASEIHGITDEMLRGQPRFIERAPALSRMLSGSVPVAHNARFDESFLLLEYELAGLWAPEAPILDTLGLSRRVLALSSHRLASICEHFDIGRGVSHRALDDAHATWQMAWRLLDLADPTHQLTVEDAHRMCRRPNTEEIRVLTLALQESARQAVPVLIDYRRSDAQPSRRSITVQRILGSRVEAFCHLRGEDRVFRIDRISLVG